MESPTRFLAVLVLSLSVGAAAGCKKDTPGDLNPTAAEVDWPQEPADGSPIAVVFDKMIGEGERLGADVRIFNFADAPLRRLQLELKYLDDKGVELRTFPFTAMAPALAPAKGHALIQVGAFVPPETVRIESVVEAAEFEGDAAPRWVREGATVAPVHRVE